MTPAQSLCRSLVDDPKHMVAERLYDQLGIARKFGDAMVSDLCKLGALARRGDCLKIANRALANDVIGGTLEAWPAPIPATVPVAVDHDAESTVPKLSPSELDVFTRYMEGKDAKVIALELDRTVSTVHSLKDRFMRKFGVKGDIALTKYAIRNGLVRL